MLHSVSPWSATVQLDIDSSPEIYTTEFPGFTITIHNTEDSLWIVTRQPNRGRIAFRAAYGMGKSLSNVSLQENQSGIILSANTVLGSYSIELTFERAGLFRYVTKFTANEPLLIPFWPRDIVPLTDSGKTENTTGTVHVQQVGSRSGQLFFTQTRPANGSVLYFQNLSALADYCEDTQTTAAETVGGSWPEIGFKLPYGSESPIQGKKEYTISDAFVLLSPEMPQHAFEVAEFFLNGLAQIYIKIPKPETLPQDWIDISKKALKELETNKGCWTYSAGHPYMNAYLCDYETPPESMVQLAVLSAIVEYDQWTGENLALVDEIKAGIPAFYDPKLKTLSRWLPSSRDKLDESEEQKAPMTMDSWYLHHPLMMLSRLALMGDKQAEQLLLDAVPYAIKVAHHFNFVWPVFYKMDSLEVLKAETAPGMGGEKDVAGSYTYIMVNLYRITKDKYYLNEAIKAAKELEQFGLSIFYQANNTAFSALALLRLFKETGDDFHLRMSYLCLAGIMKNVQFFESHYGYSKNFPNFFGVYPLNDAPYKAPYEEMEVYAALNDYVKEADEMNAPILPAVKLLLAEFVRYSINRLSFYYPPMLPPEILTEEVKTGELDPKLWVPVEDLYDGWEKNGQVGQEVYGAGVGFGIVPRQYVQLDGQNLMLFTDYPIVGLRHSKNGVTFRILGDAQMQCRIILFSTVQKTLQTATGAYKDGKTYKDIAGTSKPGCVTFEAKGNSNFRLSW